MDNNELNNNLENNNVNEQFTSLNNSEPVNNVQNNILNNSEPINNIQNSMEQNDNMVSDNTNSFTQPNNLKDKLVYQNSEDIYTPQEEPKEVVVEKSGKGSKILIFFLILIILGLGAYIVYDKFLNNNIPKTNKKEEKTVENTSKYNNFTEKEIQGVSNDLPVSNLKDLTLKIVDGKLTAKLDGNDITVKGLEGNIRSFVDEKEDCAVGFPHIVIAINDKNELFYENVDGYSRSDYLTFKKLNLNEEVVDITKNEFCIYYSTCSCDTIGVVLKDGKIKLLNVETNYDNTSKIYNISNVSISDYDVTNFAYSNQSIMVYKDNTIGKFDNEGKYTGSEFSERLKYDGNILKISKLYNPIGSNDNIYSYYIISNNKLYKFDVDSSDTPRTTPEIKKVTLISNSNVKSESIDTSKEELYEFDYNDSKDITITFEDGTTHTINGVYSVYNAK